MNKTYIGISGPARAGKNLFADIAIDILKNKGISAKSFALAYYLKKDCEQFVTDKLNLSVWSEKTEDKNIFRPMLVWYGDIKRKQTQGRYWTELLQKDLQESTAQINIITDLRYSIYDRDEIFWLQQELNGKLIHLDKYKLTKVATNRFAQPQESKVYVNPANEHEMLNDPIVKRQSDVKVEWPDVTDICGNSYSCLINDAKLREIVTNTLIQCKLIEEK